MNNNNNNNNQLTTTYNGYPNINKFDTNTNSFDTINDYPNSNNINQNWVTPQSTNLNNNQYQNQANVDNQNINHPGRGHPPQPQMQTPNYAQNEYSKEKILPEKFENQPKFRDLWALILFILTLVSFFAVLGLNLYKLNFSLFSNSSFLSVSNDTYLISIIGGIILSLLVSGLYLIWMLNAPGLLISISFWFNVLLYFVMGLFLLSIYSNPLNLIFGILMLLTAIIYSFIWFSWKKFIPFSTLILSNITKFILKFPSSIMLSFSFLIIVFIFYSVWTFTFMSVLFNYSNSGCEGYTCNNVSLWFLIIFLIFVIYWVSQCLKDILYIAISGSLASDYFFPNTNKFTVAKSLGRALTTSLGSACFGSLLIAIVQSLRTLVSVARGQNNEAVVLVGCCVECLLNIFEGLLAYFNTYAYTYCAMYGQHYLEAGKSTWNLIKDRGIEAIINDSLISNVLNLGSFIVGGLSSLLAIIVIVIQVPSWELNYGFILVIILNWILGKLVFSIVASIISSCNTTFFVCLAEDPMALKFNNPSLYEKIRAQYPQIEYSV